jgi:glucokinase
MAVTGAYGGSGRTWVGVDIGGTNVRAGCLDDDGHIASWVSRPHGMASGQFHAIEEAAAEVLGEVGLGWSGVAGLGVAVAAVVDSPAGVVLDSANLGLRCLPLGTDLRQRLGVPVTIENDVCASALAEMVALPHASAPPWLYMSVGTGVGACLVLGPAEGRVLCLDIGHIPLPGESGRCRCGKVGCLETIASGAAIARAASARIAADPGHILRQRLGHITGKDVFEAALQGDETCRDIIAAAGAACGRGVGNLVNLLNPSGVGLGGGMFTSGSPYLAALVEAARSEIRPWMQDRLQFEAARLGEKAGVIGAVRLAQRRRAGPPVNVGATG